MVAPIPSSDLAAAAELGALGIRHCGPVHANPGATYLIEQAVRRGEAILAENGALVAYTRGVAAAGLLE